MNKKIEKLQEINLDFKKSNTRVGVHGIHKYPARMVPEIANVLIENLSSENDIVLDPFAGSGTTLVEAMLLKRHPIGNDINPLARLIAKVRTTKIANASFMKMRKYLKDKIKDFSNSEKIPVLTEINKVNIDYWFKPHVLDKINYLHKIINCEELSSKDIDFLKVCLSATISISSNSKNGEYKIHRMKGDKLKNHKPNPFILFMKYFEDYSKRIIELNDKKISSRYNPIVESENAMDLSKKIKDNSIDLVITSPPYGDSRTTVAYGQFSRFSLLWLGFSKENTFELDEKMLGGTKVARNDFCPNSQKLKTLFDKVEKLDKKRAMDLLNFSNDLFFSLKEIARVLKTDKYACIVIGNRAMRGVRISTDIIIQEMCDELDMEYVETLRRGIFNKNNPSSVSIKISGIKKKVPTMSKESIVILKSRNS